METPTRTESPQAAARARAIAWRHGAHAAVCERIETWEHGTSVASVRFPRYWDYNALRLEQPAPAELTAGALAAEAERRQSGLSHRKVEIEDEDTGKRLAPELAELGWRVTRLAWMRHDGSRAGPSSGVTRAEHERIAPLRAEWLGGALYGSDPAGASAFLADEQAVATLLPGHLTTYAAFDAAGEPAAYCTLRVAGPTAEIEDVYCTPGRRGRGLATALVASAVAQADRVGVRDLYIVADDDDWPKGLYARQGFRTVWLRHDALRRSG